MASPSKAVKMQTSNMTHRIAGVEVLETLGWASLDPGLSFMTPVALAIASTPDNARTTPTKPFQFLEKPPVSGCRCDRVGQVRQGKGRQEQHHHGRRQRNQEGQPARVAGAEDIEQADDRNRCRRAPFGMREAQIIKSGERTDGRRDNVIGNEKEGADNGNDDGPVAHAGINAAAVRVVAADGHVIDADQGGQQAHGGDEPEGTVAADGKGQADDVGLAGAPVAIENGGGAGRIDVARPSGVTGNDHRMERKSCGH